MAVRYNVALDQGSYTTMVLTLFQADGITPISLVGCSAQMMFRETLDGNALVTLSTAGGTIVLGGAAGTVTITFSDVTTQALSVTRGVYDLDVTFADTHPRREVQGAWILDRSVTHTP